jgi:biopolymer transport protein ExbD
MKMKTSQKVHYESGPNMTPLVDITMVILIFLMLTGSFAVGEHFLQSNVPVTQKGVSVLQDRPSTPEDPPLEIRVDSYGTEGREVWRAQAGGFAFENDTDGLQKKLKAMHDGFRSAGRGTDKIQVIINPGRQTKYKHLIDVYQAVLGAELTKVAFSTAH